MMMTRIVILGAAGALVGCSATPAGDDVDGESVGSSSEATAGQDASTGGDAADGTAADPPGETGETGDTDAPIDPNAPTYYGDIAPILSEHCSGCHVEGGIAPFQFSTYDAAAAYGALLAIVVDAKTMPPWPPGGSSPALEHARIVPDADIAKLTAWVAAGSPAGDPGAATPLPAPETVELASVDAAGDIGFDYIPDDSVSDDYHCFMIDPSITDDGILRGYQFTPGNGKVVHHVLSTLYGPQSRDAIVAQDEAAAGDGWPCGGGYSDIPGAQALSSLGGWVPGVTAANYPVGTGVAVPAGAVVVVQIHYNLAGGTDPDRTRLDLSMYPDDATANVRPLVTVPMPWPLFKIPAGESNYSTGRALRASVWANNRFPADGDAHILGVAGHMHLLGTGIKVTLINDQGPTTILEIPDWDFDWQGSYTLTNPITVHADDEIEIECIYDNSAEHRESHGMGAPVDVTWGEGTTDEMCLAYLQVVDELP